MLDAENELATVVVLPPAAPYADVVTEFEKLERFLESRLRRETS